MARPLSQDYGKALTLLRAALGEFDPKKPLRKLIARLPGFGKFEWMLTIIGLEVDLRVDIPESLADDLDRSAESFSALVADLPKVDSPGYTLECLGLVAQALLSLDLPTEPTKKQARKPSAHKTTARVAQTPRKNPTRTKAPRKLDIIMR